MVMWIYKRDGRKEAGESIASCKLSSANDAVAFDKVSSREQVVSHGRLISFLFLDTGHCSSESSTTSILGCWDSQLTR